MTKKQWPKNFFDFESITDVPDFKSYRNELLPPAESGLFCEISEETKEPSPKAQPEYPS